MPKVLVLGSDGMIGSALFKRFNESELDLYASSRRQEIDSRIYLDVTEPGFEDRLDFLSPGSYLVNCIGLIRHKISEGSQSEAWYLNSEYPKLLSNFALRNNLKLINLCTDCVYSGETGGYDENSTPDPKDLYGKSKAAGENTNAAVMNLRTSVIGPEVDSSVELLSWVLSAHESSNLNGYKNHLWNGVTSSALAKIQG